MRSSYLTRRGFSLAALGAHVCRGAARPAPSTAGPYMADMHSHYGMFMPRLFGLDLVKHMQETGTTLLAWSVTDDHRWIGRTATRAAADRATRAG